MCPNIVVITTSFAAIQRLKCFLFCLRRHGRVGENVRISSHYFLIFGIPGLLENPSPSHTQNHYITNNLKRLTEYPNPLSTFLAIQRHFLNYAYFTFQYHLTYLPSSPAKLCRKINLISSLIHSYIQTHMYQYCYVFFILPNSLCFPL